MTYPTMPQEAYTAKIQISEAADNLRIDQALLNAYPGYSRGFFQRLIRSSQVLLNEDACKPSQRVKFGDNITIFWPAQRGSDIEAEEMPLDIIYEDEDILVINKPRDLIVHPADNNEKRTLVHGLLAYNETAFTEMIDETCRPGIVHRLDRDTTGCLVIAKNDSSRRSLKTAFAARKVEKTYLLLVQGEFGAKTGTIEAPIGRNPKRRHKMAVVPENGKPAVTHYRVLATRKSVSLIEARIETGRTHQIRVHFSHICHPVIGDPQYGGKQRALPVAVSRPMLHAWKLGFPHPATAQMKEFIAEIPDDFNTALRSAHFPEFDAAAAVFSRRPHDSLV